MNRSVIILFLFSILLKICLFPSYHSTDFDVHRNWMAIVTNLPLRKWYFESTSEWTLDYPPFFAYFEYLIALLAQFFEFIIHDNSKNWIPNMLKIEEVHKPTTSTVYFMRSSVILSDVILFFSILHFTKSINQNSGKKTDKSTLVVTLLLLLNNGLLFIDHIHFQYNGILMGLLIYCCSFVYTRQYVALTVTFSILVLSKHLFAPLVIIFGVYLLRFYCLDADNATNTHNDSQIVYFTQAIQKFVNLVYVASCFLCLAFVPFILDQFVYELKSYLQQPELVVDLDTISGNYVKHTLLVLSEGCLLPLPIQFNLFKDAIRAQLQQMVMRLFPFGRGLVHAYWAPNVWALYCGLDRVLNLVWGRDGYDNAPIVGVTSGLVSDFSPIVLPRVEAIHCLLLVLVSMVPAVLCIWLCNPSVPSSLSKKQLQSYKTLRSATLFLKCIIYGSLSTFMLGYHVHEKAILVTIVPTILLFRVNSDIDKFCSTAHNPNTGATTLTTPPDDIGMIECSSSSLLLFRLNLIGTYCMFPLFSANSSLIVPKCEYCRSCGMYRYMLSFLYVYADCSAFVHHLHDVDMGVLL